jgi:ribose 5-phosphate isomerase A
MTKALVARCLAKRVRHGEVIGLGSGSTAELAVDQIGQRISREKISIAGVPTSYRIAMIAEKAGIQVLSSTTDVKLNWAFDGADEVDPQFMMIKGRGAAMLNEKIIARRAGENLLIIVSDDKLVERLGKKHPIPVEVIPEALGLVRSGLAKIGCRETVLRESTTKYGPETTEHNNLILDSWFDDIQPDLELRIKAITGVVESGLFVNATKELLVARENGVWSRRLMSGRIEEQLVEAP